jgi:glycosyltransferase involved in cell wall biosynthesis
MVSICIPVYNMHNRGVEFLQHLLHTLKCQTNKNFEIVISDDSTDNLIEESLRNISLDVDVKYIKNLSGRKGNSANLNNAIKHARYEIIKPAFQDDWIVNDSMVDDIIKSQSLWGAMGWRCSNSSAEFTPRWSNKILLGYNTIGMPTGIYFKRNEALFFDENLSLLMDCEFYYRLYKLYGAPFILPSLYYIGRIWDGAISSTIKGKRIHRKELLYIGRKYRKELVLNYYLCRIVSKIKRIFKKMQRRKNYIIY